MTQNDRKLAHHQSIHSKKLFNLCLEVSKVSHDPDKTILITILMIFQKVKKVYFVKICLRLFTAS